MLRSIIFLILYIRRYFNRVARAERCYYHQMIRPHILFDTYLKHQNYPISGMESILPLKLSIGLSMVLLYIDVVVYDKVLKWSKSRGALILQVKLCISYSKYRSMNTLKFRHYIHNFTDEINVPSDFGHSNTLSYTTILIYNSISDSPIHNSSGRTNSMPKIG